MFIFLMSFMYASRFCCNLTPISAIKSMSSANNSSFSVTIFIFHLLNVKLLHLSSCLFIVLSMSTENNSGLNTYPCFILLLSQILWSLGCAFYFIFIILTQWLKNCYHFSLNFSLFHTFPDIISSYSIKCFYLVFKAHMNFFPFPHYLFCYFSQ